TQQPPLTKRSRQDDPNNTVIQMDYSLTTPTPTAFTIQLQQSGQNTILPENNKLIWAPVPAPTSMGKTTEIPMPIITTNTIPNLDTLTTEPSLLTADNLALVPDSTANFHQDLPIDTHSNATIEFLPKKILYYCTY
ncbi:20741_t:CDS:2, partial [Dentiscutata erythropus]